MQLATDNMVAEDIYVLMEEVAAEDVEDEVDTVE